MPKSELSRCVVSPQTFRRLGHGHPNAGGDQTVDDTVRVAYEEINRDAQTARCGPEAGLWCVRQNRHVLRHGNLSNSTSPRLDGALGQHREHQLAMVTYFYDLQFLRYKLAMSCSWWRRFARFYSE